MDLQDSLKFVIVHCGMNNVGKDGPVDSKCIIFNCKTHTKMKA